jgi:hypothetical protein
MLTFSFSGFLFQKSKYKIKMQKVIFTDFWEQMVQRIFMVSKNTKDADGTGSKPIFQNYKRIILQKLPNYLIDTQKGLTKKSF